LPGRRALLGEEGAEEVLRFRLSGTDEERWSVVKATPIFDKGGNVRMAVNILRDVTEQRRTEKERARLAAIVESSNDAIIGKTLDGVIISWNEAAERIYGYSSEEVVGQPISVLVPSDRPAEVPTILDSVRRGEKVEPFDTVRITKDGRRLDISLTVSPIRNFAGDVVGAPTIARDITGRKRAEEEIRLLNEQLEQRGPTKDSPARRSQQRTGVFLLLRLPRPQGAHSPHRRLRTDAQGVGRAVVGRDQPA
jgi:PAS domain S-box-containing protein